MNHGRFEKLILYPAKPTFPFFTGAAVPMPYLQKPDTLLYPEVQELSSHLYNPFSVCPVWPSIFKVTRGRMRVHCKKPAC